MNTSTTFQTFYFPRRGMRTLIINIIRTKPRDRSLFKTAIYIYIIKGYVRC